MAAAKTNTGGTTAPEATETTVEEVLAQLAAAQEEAAAAKKEAEKQKKAAGKAKADLEAAKAENADIQKKLEDASEKAPTPENLQAYLREKVKYRIPFVNKDDPDVFVSVNGESFQIQRGVDVKIPRFVAIHLDQQRTAEEEILRMQSAMAKRAKAGQGALSR
ncbi:MAG: hypothetical protein ACQ5SW_08385 [Sphaerochaetaceae bacterium]